MGDGGGRMRANSLSRSMNGGQPSDVAAFNVDGIGNKLTGKGLTGPIPATATPAFSLRLRFAGTKVWSPQRCPG